MIDRNPVILAVGLCAGALLWVFLTALGELVGA